MNPEREELVHRALDGELQPGEREQLDRELAASPELRALSARLEKLDETLGEWEDEEPPAELRPRILSAVERSSPPRRAIVGGLHRPTRREVTAFALGSVAALIAFAIFGSPPFGAVQPEDAAGALVPGPAPVAHEILLDGRSIGTVEWAPETPEITVRLLDSAPTHVEFALDPEGDAELIVEREGSTTQLDLPAEGEN